MSKDKIFLIVGLGLMGGSYARGLKKNGFTVFAIDKDPEAIDYALKENIIDKGSTEDDESLISEADNIIISVYPKGIFDWVDKNKDKFKNKVYLTDLCGIKSGIVNKVQDILPAGAELISTHPMAGRELRGVKNSDENIFKDANYIIVKTDKNSEEAVSFARELGELLGFTCESVLSVDEHDEMIAYLSQLTHCIAISLMNGNDNESLYKFTGDSFRDLTRIANINENLWSELFVDNKEKLLDSIDVFVRELNALRDDIEREDMESIKEKMRSSTERRKKFDKQR